MGKQKTVRTNKSYTLDNKFELLALFARAVKWVCQLCFRYRTELGLVFVVLAVYLGSRREVGPRWATFVTLTGISLVLVVPLSRRLVLGRLSCARSRRLIAKVFRQTRVENVDGQLPAIVRSRVTPAGERLTIWCRAGQSAELLDARVEELRAGAHCRHVTVTRDPNRSHRVTVDVIRRETLAGVVITSPLVRLASRLDPADTIQEG